MEKKRDNKIDVESFLELYDSGVFQHFTKQNCRAISESDTYWKVFTFYFYGTYYYLQMNTETQNFEIAYSFKFYDLSQPLEVDAKFFDIKFEKMFYDITKGELSHLTAKEKQIQNDFIYNLNLFQ